MAKKRNFDTAMDSEVVYLDDVTDDEEVPWIDGRFVICYDKVTDTVYTGKHRWNIVEYLCQ